MTRAPKPPPGPTPSVSMSEEELYALDVKVMRLAERGWINVTRSAFIRAAIAAVDPDRVIIPTRARPTPVVTLEMTAAVSIDLRCNDCGETFAAVCKTKRPTRCPECRRRWKAKRLDDLVAHRKAKAAAQKASSVVVQNPKIAPIVPGAVK